MPDDPQSNAPQLTRENLLNGLVEEYLIEAERLGFLQRTPPEVRARSKRQMLASIPAEDDVWLFGYGSLMWNPCIHFVERVPALLRGYHRRFCLETPLGRGTPDRPGLTLALMNGGSCRGIGFRLDRERADEELDLVWNREMISGAYKARRLPVQTSDGNVQAITFVINRQHPRFVGHLTLEQTADILAVAAGRLGSCADYLFNTVEHLDELGIGDGPMHDLRNMVSRRQVANW